MVTSLKSKHEQRLKKPICIIRSEEGTIHTVYGVNAVAPDGTILSSCPDIFFDSAAAKSFVDRLNRTRLSLIHLPDVIEDALAEQYAIVP